MRHEAVRKPRRSDRAVYCQRGPPLQQAGWRLGRLQKGDYIGAVSGPRELRDPAPAFVWFARRRAIRSARTPRALQTASRRGASPRSRRDRRQPICPVIPSAGSTALCNLQLAATQISQVIVPQWIGESKVDYRFPYKLEGGLVFYYGSYRDEFNPNLNGVLRTFNVYVGRTW